MELLGVIVILSLLMILLVPNVLEQINNKKTDVSEAEKETIKAAAELYVEEHSNELISCVCITTLQNDGKLSDNIIDVYTGEDYSETFGVIMNGKTAKDFGNCESC